MLNDLENQIEAAMERDLREYLEALESEELELEETQLRTTLSAGNFQLRK